MSTGVCQNWAERGTMMMGSYWSARSWHCEVAVEVARGAAAAEEERTQRLT